jgi:hypothetical protein
MAYRGRFVYIYALCDPETHAVRYVGFTSKTLEERLRGHLKERKTCHRKNWIKSVVARGLKPEISVIEEFFDANWQERERYWIAYYRSIGSDLVNGTDGGDGIPNPTEEVRRKISLGQLGRIQTPEHRRKNGDANRGRKHSPEWCQHIREGLLGKKHTQERRRKNSESQRGRKLTPEQRQKIGNASRGRRKSPEALRKMSIFKKMWWANKKSSNNQLPLFKLEK